MSARTGQMKPLGLVCQRLILSIFGPRPQLIRGRKFPKLLPPVGGSRWYKEERIGSRRGVPEIDLTGPGR